MTTVKVGASLCGALLVLLLGQWAADGVYNDSGHGAQAYVIDTGADDDAAEVEEVSFADVYAQADVEKGARVFRKCSACHKLEAGANGTGPYLYAVVNRPIGAAEGFGYSSSMASHGGEWTPEALNEFLEKPSSYVPGTSMAFSGLRKIQERADVIAYLESISN